MNLNESRIGVYLPPLDALWSGTVSGYDSDTFTLTVTTSTGSLGSVSAGVAVWTVGGQVARVKSVDGGAGTIGLAETSIDFQVSDALTVYNVRLPFPRYQRVTEDGTVYKDFDIAYPGQYAAMPPISGIWPEAIVAEVGESVPLSAVHSRAMAVGATISTYTWDAGSGGTIAGSGSSVSVSYSTAGFRYLVLAVTDSHGTQSERYIPVWIDQDPLEAVTGCRMSWRAGGGWSADVTIETPPSYLQRSPVVIADLETDEILFYGFIHPQRVSYDFEREELSCTALSPLAYMRLLYSYPFVLESVGLGVADDWAEVYNCTLQRAAWVLLYWHSTIPALSNVTLPLADRSIAGQPFSAGTLLSQFENVLQAAFWQARGWRTGGLGVNTDPLYNASFGSLTAITLDEEDIEGRIQYERRVSDLSEARLSGVYYDSGWQTIIVRAPSHPNDLGNPGEVTALAPLDADECRFWAGRHMAISQSLAYDLKSLVDIDPSTKFRVVLPDSTELALETINLTHDADRLRWNLTFNGRTYGTDATTADEPPPPEVDVPGSDAPGTAPVDPLPPDETWAEGNILALGRYNDHVGSADRYKAFVYITENATDASPSWVDITRNLNTAFKTGSLYVHDLEFQQAGDNPKMLYAVIYDTTTGWHLAYLSDPLDGGTSQWTEITLPTGYRFYATNNANFKNFWPRLMTNPGVDGRMLVNVHDTTDYVAQYALVIEDGAITFGPSFVGGAYNFRPSQCLSWYDEDTFLATVNYFYDSAQHIDAVKLDATTLLAKVSGDSNLRTFATTYRLCASGCPTSGTPRYCPTWFGTNMPVALPGYGLLRVADTSDHGGVSLANECAASEDYTANFRSDAAYGGRCLSWNRHEDSGLGVVVSLDNATQVRYSTDGFASNTPLAIPTVAGKTLRPPFQEPVIFPGFFYQHYPEKSLTPGSQGAVMRYDIGTGWTDISGDLPWFREGGGPARALALYWGKEG